MTDDDDSADSEGTAKKIWTEFQCPECEADNPYDDGFGFGHEVACHWCGRLYLVRGVTESKYRFEEV